MPEHYLRALRLVVGVTLPVCLIIGALAHPAVVAIYGPRWSPAASALLGLSVLGAGRILIELSGDFLVSLGRTRAVLIAQVPWLVALTVTLVTVAPSYGIRGVGVAQACVVAGVVGPVYAISLQRAGVRVSGMIRAVVPAVVWAVVAAVVARAVASTISSPFLACAAGASVDVVVAAIPFAPMIVRHGSSVLRGRGMRGGLAEGSASVDHRESVAQAQA
jgi:lipopolysaccharide exporter